MDAYDELYAYTMGRAGFILQHVVDAHKAQTATPATAAIGVVFSLVGLYLHVEHGFTGTQVQQAHMRMGAKKRTWPIIELPLDRGAVTAAEVLAVPAGPARDPAIDEWCRVVWRAFCDSRDTIVALTREQIRNLEL
jgi:hypothetical protein